MQADATLSQAAPVSGTKYTILDTTHNVRLLGAYCQCTWTVQPTPLEMHLTIDGIVNSPAKVDPVSDTPYFLRFPAPFHDDAELVTQDDSLSRAFVLEARSLKIELEITGGTVSSLDGRIAYAMW